MNTGILLELSNFRHCRWESIGLI